MPNQFELSTELTNHRIGKPHNKVERTRPRGKPFEKGNVYAWKPGASGNPSGRPKLHLLSEAYRSRLAQVDPDDAQERTYAEVIAEHLCKVAAGLAKGNSTRAAHEIADRTEGKARQAVYLDPVGEAKQLLALLLGVSVDELPPPETRAVPR
jgi:hypothetical protein